MVDKDTTPCVSFIGIVDFTQDAKWIFMTESVSDLLGYEPRELVGRSSLELVHPDEFPQVKQIHYDTINQDKAAVLAYLRMKHKDPYKGFVLCGISRTVVHNVLVGSVSFASPGAKALHNNSTAQEVTVITPSATDFELRRWGDPSPMPPSPIPSSMLAASPNAELLNPPYPTSFSSPTSRSSQEREREREREKDRKDKDQNCTTSNGTQDLHNRPGVITFDQLPTQSVRTALILDRFSEKCHIIYCSNDLLVSTTDVMGIPFCDLVASRDEDNVQKWIDVVKGWGVNETGQPSDGGFGFGKFHLCTKPRVSRIPNPPSRHGAGHSRRAAGSGGGRTHNQGRAAPRVAGSRPRIYSHSANAASSSSAAATSPATERTNGSSTQPEPSSVLVDAIFSAHSDGVMVILRRGSAS